MELFTRLPDDIKILIITEFTGQFKMRNDKLMAQLNKKFLDKMNILLYKTQHYEIITSFYRNKIDKTFNVIISLNIKISENTYDESYNNKRKFIGYSEKWYIIIIERNMHLNMEYKKTCWFSSFKERDPLDDTTLYSTSINEKIYESII